MERTGLWGSRILCHSRLRQFHSPGAISGPLTGQTQPLTSVSCQVVLFSPYALLFLNILGGSPGATLTLDYSHTAASVGIVRVHFFLACVIFPF